MFADSESVIGRELVILFHNLIISNISTYLSVSVYVWLRGEKVQWTFARKPSLENLFSKMKFRGHGTGLDYYKVSYNLCKEKFSSCLKSLAVAIELKQL